MTIFLDIIASASTIFFVSIIIFLLVIKTILWVDKKLDKLTNFLENELLVKIKKIKPKKQRKKISNNNDKKESSWLSSGILKIIRPSFGGKYKNPSVQKSKSDESHKEKRKHLELIYKRKSSHELLRLEIENSKKRKRKMPNRFYDLVRNSNTVDTVRNDICYEIGRTMKEILKEEEDVRNDTKNNVLRGRTNCMGDACDVVYELKSYMENEIEEKIYLYKGESVDSFTKTCNLEAKPAGSTNQTDFEKNKKLVDIFTGRKPKINFKKLEKTKNTNYNLKSNSKIMNIIRLFTVEKLLNINSNQNLKKGRIKNINHKSNMFNIIYMVKKYSHYFTETEKNNFLARIITPMARRKLRSRYNFDLKKNKSKISLSLISSAHRENSPQNKKKYERVHRLINFRIKLNACLAFYYNIRPESNDNLMKLWDIFRNVKFNLFHNKPSSHSIQKLNINTKVKRQVCCYYNYRKEKLSVSKKVTGLEITKTQSFPMFINNCYIKIQCCTCVSNESLKKFVRTNKINSDDDNHWSESQDTIDLSKADVKRNQPMSSKYMKNKYLFYSLIESRLLGFFEKKTTKKRSKKKEELPLINKMYTPRFLSTRSDDYLGCSEYSIHSFTSIVDLKHEKEESSNIIKQTSLPVVKPESPVNNLSTNSNNRILISAKSKMLELEKRIKQSKAIVNPIKSTITDYVIPANTFKNFERKNEIKSVDSVCNNLAVTTTPELYKIDHERVEQIYKNPNFKINSSNKEKCYPNFIEKNKKYIMKESKLIQEKVKCNANLRKESEINFRRNQRTTEHSFNKTQKVHPKEEGGLEKNSVKTSYILDKTELKEKYDEECFLPLAWREEPTKNYSESEGDLSECDERLDQNLLLNKNISSLENNNSSNSDINLFGENEIEESKFTDSSKDKSNNRINEDESGNNKVDDFGNLSELEKNIPSILYDKNVNIIKKTRENKSPARPSNKSPPRPSSKSLPRPVNKRPPIRRKCNLGNYSSNTNELSLNTNRRPLRTTSYSKYEDKSLFNTDLKSVNETARTNNLLSSTSIDKKINSDTILEKIEESLKTFQRLNDDEILMLQNMIYKCPCCCENNETEDDSNFVGTGEVFNNNVSNPLKNIEDQWENEFKNSTKASYKCTCELIKLIVKNNSNKWMNETDCRLKTSNEKLGNSKSNQSKTAIEEWSNELTNLSRKLKLNSTNKCIQTQGDDAIWTNASTQKEKLGKVTLSNFIFNKNQPYLPFDCESDGNDNSNSYFHGSDKISWDESPDNTCYSIDSQDELKNYNKPSSEWLLPHVINVNSEECVFDQKECKENETKRERRECLREYLSRMYSEEYEIKKDRRTRLQEYLRRYNFDVEMSPKIVNRCNINADMLPKVIKNKSTHKFFPLYPLFE